MKGELKLKLFIDTTDREKIVIGIDEEKFETISKEKSSQKLLIFIDEILMKKNKNIEDITEIEVKAGPGSFTGIRVGVAVSNALSWNLRIPVNGQLTSFVDLVYK